MYVDCCKELSEVPNMKVLKKLYNLEVRRILAVSILSFPLLSDRHAFSFSDVGLNFDFVQQLILACFCQLGFRWWNHCVWVWPARFVYNPIDKCTGFPKNICNAWPLSQFVRYILLVCGLFALDSALLLSANCPVTTLFFLCFFKRIHSFGFQFSSVFHPLMSLIIIPWLVNKRILKP